MFEKAMRAVTLGMFVASGLFVALLAAIMAATLGGVVGYSSSVLLRALLPQLFSGGADWDVWLVIGGVAVGGLGGLLLIGRAMWMDFKQSGILK